MKMMLPGLARYNMFIYTANENKKNHSMMLCHYIT